ncbi:hypothetical protein [Arcobacter vandammei]|uniref:hypothetical protein n=1 Tax=Arcobacter vandammei TaxID=2782243 RepID=UPI0018E02CA0|nr:hypothetical protein [Arcobacter vandammei]
MIIQNSQVELYSQSQSISKHSYTESVQKHYGAKEDPFARAETKSEAFSLNFQYSHSQSTQSSRAVVNSEDMLSPEDRIKKLIIERLLERLTNKSVSLYPKSTTNQSSSFEFNFKEVKAESSAQRFVLNPYINANSNQNQTQQELKGIIFETKNEYYQKESIDFGAKIKFNTPNKSYDMSLDISFSKEFYEKSSLRVVVGEDIFTDPLVVNFGEDVNPFDNLSSLKFAFDLDNDGATEMIPYLKAGAGYLVLDKNENGKIDNGNELFGPNSGNGFKELALYDGDKNGFIDEADEVFSKLKIWSFDEKGNSSLISLLDANVGAIYLGDVQSGFKYIDGINSTLASSQSNGIFIKEDGTGLGVVNSIDILV